MDLYQIILWGAVAAVALFGYLFYEETRKPKLEEAMPMLRQTMVVLTKRGLMTPKNRIELGGGKFHLYYDHPSGYNAVYKEGELVEVDKHQATMGTGRPIHIEREMLLELAYGENKVLKSLTREILEELVRKTRNPELSRLQQEEILKDIKNIQDVIAQEPLPMAEVQEALRHQTDKSLRYESELRALQSGEEGRLTRRTEPILELAGKRAARKEPGSRGSDESY